MFFYPNFSAHLMKKRERVFVNSIKGEYAELSYIRLEPGESTFHSHPSEQMGLILAGEVELNIGNEIRICKPGDGYYIPSNTDHGFKVLNDQPVEFTEVFCPPKV